jgi:hypothetical protein
LKRHGEGCSAGILPLAPRSPSTSSGSFVLGQDDRAKRYRPQRHFRRGWEVRRFAQRPMTSRPEPRISLASNIFPLYLLPVRPRFVHASDFKKLREI